MPLGPTEVPLSGSDILTGITDRIELLNQGAPIPLTNFNPKVPGLYEIFVYAMCTVGEALGGTLDFMLTHTDEVGVEEVDFGGFSLATPGRQSSIFLTRNITSTMSFRTLLTGNFTTAKFSLYIVVRKV